MVLLSLRNDTALIDSTCAFDVELGCAYTDVTLEFFEDCTVSGREIIFL
jgi:hypothetical protein